MNVDDPLQPFFANQRAVILDGGLATELERRGADLHDELWSARLLIENPASIRQLHLDYFLAGADVAVSASYQASFEGFARRGLSRKESAALLESSVRIAQQARDHFWEELRVPADREKRKATSGRCFGRQLWGLPCRRFRVSGRLQYLRPGVEGMAPPEARSIAGSRAGPGRLRDYSMLAGRRGPGRPPGRISRHACMAELQLPRRIKSLQRGEIRRLC